MTLNYTECIIFRKFLIISSTKAFCLFVFCNKLCTIFIKALILTFNSLMTIPRSDEEEAEDNLYFLPVAPEIDDPEVS